MQTYTVYKNVAINYSMKHNKEKDLCILEVKYGYNKEHRWEKSATLDLEDVPFMLGSLIREAKQEINNIDL